MPAKGPHADVTLCPTVSTSINRAPAPGYWSSLDIGSDMHPKLRSRSAILPGLERSAWGLTSARGCGTCSLWETLIDTRRRDNTEVRFPECEILATRLGKGEPGLARDKVLTEQRSLQR